MNNEVMNGKYIKIALGGVLGGFLAAVGFSALDSWQFWVIMIIYAVGAKL